MPPRRAPSTCWPAKAGAWRPGSCFPPAHPAPTCSGDEDKDGTAGLLAPALSACRPLYPVEEEFPRLGQAPGSGHSHRLPGLFAPARRRRCGADELPAAQRTPLTRMRRRGFAVPAVDVAAHRSDAAGIAATAGRRTGRWQAGRLRLSQRTLNACAGGSPRSRHLSNNALDLDIPGAASDNQRLCAYWRKQGPAMKLGLGSYTKTRIHLDTSGFRTWGNDHTWRTSLCTDRPHAAG